MLACVRMQASSAKWEPPHGRFRSFFFPWSHYVRVGAVLRHCAYEVVAMHGCLHSEIQVLFFDSLPQFNDRSAVSLPKHSSIPSSHRCFLSCVSQAPHGIRKAFQPEIQEAAAQAAELVRVLGSDVDGMVHSFERLNLLKGVHSSAYRLQLSLELRSHLLTSTPAVEPNGGCSLESNMRRQQRRLRSWPSREVDELEEDAAGVGGGGHVATRMRALESTAALSLATFASLLIEFVARLDHLVDAVDELSKLAKFREDGEAS